MKTERCRIAILAKSNKQLHNGGYGSCVAGITEGGEWIRLVSSEDGDSIPQGKANYIPINSVIKAEIRRAPLVHQIENAMLLYFTVTQDSIEPFLQGVHQVEENGIFGNFSNKLSCFEANQNNGTLRLIRVEHLKTYRRPSENCKAEFTYCGHKYIDLAMTDPNCYAASGTIRSFGNAFIVVSLPEDSP